MEELFLNNWKSIGHVFIIVTLTCGCMVVQLQVIDRRTLSHINSLEFLVMVALGSTFTTILLIQGVTLANVMLGFALLLLIHAVTVPSSRVSSKAINSAGAAPVLLFYQGLFLNSAMEAECITKEELLSALLRNGITTFKEVHAVVMEKGKKITIIRRAKDSIFEIE